MPLNYNPFIGPFYNRIPKLSVLAVLLAICSWSISNYAIAFTVPSTAYTQSSTASFTISWKCSSHFCYLEEKSGTSWLDRQYIQGDLSQQANRFSRTLGTHTFRVRRCTVTGTRYGTSHSCTNDSPKSISIRRYPSSSPTPILPTTSTTGNYVISWGSISHATTYQVHERANGGSWRRIGTTSSSDRRLSLASKSSGAYEYRINACAIRCASASTIKKVTVALEPSRPAYINLTSENPTEADIAFTWGKATGLVSSYKIKIEHGGVIRKNLTVPSIQLSYSTSMDEEGSYTASVKSCNNVSGFEACSSWRTTEQIVLANTKPDQDAPESNVSKLSRYAGTPLATVAEPLEELITDDVYLGAVKGEHQITSAGDLSYDVPLDIPIGINGVEPSLSLKYNSSGRNGVVGWGWRLSGLPRISRCRASWAVDRYVSGLSNQDDYQYCLDGKRLIELPDGSYKTVEETFTRIEKKSGYWTQIYPDGTTYRFGYVSNAKTKSINSVVSEWSVDNVKDIYGNSYDVAYTIDGNPSVISYTKRPSSPSFHKVIFSYHNRPDPFGNYVSGDLRLEKQRLSKITMEAKDGFKWSYNLHYEVDGKSLGGNTYRNPVNTSRLYKIDQCFDIAGKNCRNPINFEWNKVTTAGLRYTPAANNSDDRYTAPDLPSGTGTSQNLYVDVDGDGYKDLISIPETKDRFSVYLNSSNSNFNPRFSSSPDARYSTGESKLTFYGKRDYTRVHGWGASGESATTTVQDKKFAYTFQFADVTGNGLVDLVRFPPGCTDFMERCKWHESFARDISVAVNHGGGFGAFIPWASAGSGSGPQSAYYLDDVNGDGLVDIKAVSSTPDVTARFYLRVAINSGKSWNGKGFMDGSFDWHGNSSNWNNIRGYSGDFNGDGLSDFVQIPTRQYHKYEKDIVEKISVSMATGVHSQDVSRDSPRYSVPHTVFEGSFVNQCGNDSEVTDECHWSVVDYNGDGFDDLVEVGFNKTKHCNAGSGCKETTWNILNLTARVYLSKGIDGAGVIQFDQPRIVLNSSIMSAANISRMTDSDINNFSQFFDYDQNGGIESHHRLSNGMSGHYIERVKGGGAGTIDISYTSIDNKAVYSQRGDLSSSERRRTGVASQIENLSSKRVVQNIDITDSLSFKKSTGYKYENYIYDNSGHGELGFLKVEELESITGEGGTLRTVSHYHQDVKSNYKISGKLKRREVFYADVDGNAISKIEDDRFQWKVSILNYNSYYMDPAYYHAFVYQKSTEKWDLFGNIESHTVTYNHEPEQRDCSPLSNSDVDKVLTEDSFTEHDDGVLLYSETIVCDSNDSSNKIVVNARKKSDIVRKGKRTGLAESVQILSWTGRDIDSFSESSFDIRPIRYSYFSNGSIQFEEEFPSAPAEAGANLKKSYLYDEYGYVSRETLSWKGHVDDGLGFTSTYSVYENIHSSDGARLTTISRPLVGDEIVSYEPVFGRPVQKVDVNGLIATLAYDSVGRPLLLSRDDNYVSFGYFKCSRCFSGHSRTAWYQYEKESGSSPIFTYFASGNRVVGSQTVGLNGDLVHQVNSYNALGKVSYQSDPYFEFDSSSKRITRYYYDRLGRITSVRYPDSTQTATVYRQGRVITTNRLGQVNEKIVSPLGWPLVSYDAQDGRVSYRYDAKGNLSETVLGAGGSDLQATKIQISYDTAGRRMQLSDPSVGTVTYRHNSLGLLSEQRDANGFVTKYQYDKLGRELERIDDATGSAASHRWIYDTSLHGKGKLHKLTGTNTDGTVYSETHSYTTQGLPKTIATTIDTRSFSVERVYDNYNRLLATKYPSGYQVANIYNDYGNLSEQVATSDRQIVWRAVESNADGAPIRFLLGDGSETSKSYDALSGRIESIRSVRSGVILQDHFYDFDALGNLESRENIKSGVKESFCYDDLNRLVASRFDGCSVSQADYRYDALGNILEKNGVNDYSYGLTDRPNAVSVANGTVYQYDASGNMFKSMKANGTSRAVEYSPFNKPVRMSKEGAWTEIEYGSRKQRVRRLDSTGRESLYISDFYEETKVGGVVTRIHRINPHVNYVQKTGASTESYHEYRHLDHQGSVVAITTDRSTSMEALANAPWGERKLRLWDGPLDPGYDAVNSRGYTGHEHLDPVGLIHMNGRVFDPELGRFLTPDPIIQAPGNTQSYNRYSYTFNNPLSYTDPSGYESLPVEEVSVTGRREKESGCSYGNVSSKCAGMTRIEDYYPNNQQNHTYADNMMMVVVGRRPHAQEGRFAGLRGKFDEMADGIAWRYNAVANGLSEDFSDGFVEGMIRFTGGRSDQGFFEDTLDNYLSTSLTVGMLKNADRTAVSFLVAGSMAQTWGGYTAGQYLLRGPAPHLGTHSGTLRLVAGTTALNTVLVTGSYEGGNAAGSLVRTSVNRFFRMFD